MTEKTETTQSRRDFLKLAGTAAPAAAVAAVGVSGSEVAAETVEATTGKMKDTAHTRAYFDSTRF